MAHIRVKEEDVRPHLVQMRPTERDTDMQEFELTPERINGGMIAVQDNGMPLGKKGSVPARHLITFSIGG
ncbi:hypothetical protein [Rhizobium skierniewicense]|uniref:hypothetical protein n=1 Tax=Rhizobium skierniewicense TaxID=984260 RepID=UPI001F157956|nr:hypothetical protein [Rhizobium skierniewicense]